MRKTEELRRVKWKDHFFLNKSSNDRNRDYFGFKNCDISPHEEQLDNFENDLMDIITKLTFHKKKNQFQKGLDSTIGNINDFDYLFIKADKTHSFYKLTKP